MFLNIFITKYSTNRILFSMKMLTIFNNFLIFAYKIKKNVGLYSFGSQKRERCQAMA